MSFFSFLPIFFLLPDYLSENEDNMIDGFEEITCPLDDYEQGTLLPVMVQCLKKHIGRENAVNNNFMCASLSTRGYSIGAARVRKLINYIRVNDLVPCLMATSVGYYVTEDPLEMQKYIRSLRGRISAISEVLLAMEAQYEGMRPQPPKDKIAS